MHPTRAEATKEVAPLHVGFFRVHDQQAIAKGGLGHPFFISAPCPDHLIAQ
jgi:hypothetical protein